MPEKEGRVLDAHIVRSWCVSALDALGRAREEIDSINVYPVADGDTGTNLYLTMEAAHRAVEAVFQAHEASTAARRPADGDDAAADVGGVALRAPSLAEAARGMAHGALVGARGNSGTILAQLLRGMAQVFAAEADAATGRAPETPADAASSPRDPHGAAARRDASHVADGARLSLALRRAAQSGYEAVAHPVEGTVLTVATAAADACAGVGEDCADVARAAYEGARQALDATPGQLAVLGRAGVVDAGGRGLLAVLGALVEALGGEALGGGVPLRPARWQERHPQERDPQERRPRDRHPQEPPPTSASTPRHGAAATPDGAGAAAVTDAADAACADDVASWDGTGPGYEVIYLLDAEDAAVARLRERLDGLGDSLVVVGGDGLWNIHVHVDDAGAAVEAGIEAGRPHRVRITHFAADTGRQGTGGPHGAGSSPDGEPVARAVVAVVPGEGLAALYAAAGATTVPARPGELPGSGELAAAVRRAHAREVVLLPNDAALLHTAAAAAEEARGLGVRVSVIPTRSAVQGIAALAVHERERRFDEDAVAMTSAAGATRYAEIAVAEHRSWTSAGICQAGDVLGLIDGDVAVIGQDVAATACSVLDRMLAAGGEMVTLVLGESPGGSGGPVGEAGSTPSGTTQDGLARDLEEHVRVRHLAVDSVVYHGGRNAPLMLIGVE